jgi:hypothetical protein
VLSSKNKKIREEEANCLIVPIATGEGPTKMAKVFIRPGVFDFLRDLKAAGFELVLFTAGNRYYMNSVVSAVFTSD